MPSTRATRARKAVQVENNKPTVESSVLGAKTRKTRSSAAPKTRKHLQNITNPVAETSSPPRTRPPQTRAVVVRMRTLSKAEIAAAANEVEVAVANLKLGHKRKNSDGSESGNGSSDEPQCSPIKRNKLADPTEKSPITKEASGSSTISANSSFENGNTNEQSPRPSEVQEPIRHNGESKPSAASPVNAIDQSPADKQEEDKPKEKMDDTPIEATPTIYHIDDEKPSTSKAALAACAAAAATAPSPAASPSPSTVGRRLRSLRKKKTSTRTSTDKDENEQDETKSNHETDTTTSNRLRIFISNLYLNAVDRLKLDYPSRCSEDLEYCYQNHYRAELPETPNSTQSNYLRCALQQQRYGVFISLCTDMCLRGEFPGEGIFTDIIEMVLSFNQKAFNNRSIVNFFQQSIQLFSMIVRKFPPCWMSLRKFYTNFFECPLDANKISKKNDQPFKANHVLEIVLELLESALEQCGAEDLQGNDNAFQVLPDSQDAFVKSPNDTTFSSNLLNIWEWDAHMNHLHTFEELHSPSVRLERLFIALQLMLHILESDLVMWILHHHKKAKEWIFCSESQPLIVPVFIITKYTRLTDVVRHLFTIFSISVNKGLKRAHLVILERFISLVMVTSNIADLEYTAVGVRYPNLGSETKKLIGEFFKIFKSHNTANITQYLDTIDILRIPFVRFEFIDHFLELFYYSSNVPMGPRKITNEFTKMRWLKYKPQAELTEDDNELSREQYLHLLLVGLQEYCEWIGKNFNQLLTNDKPITRLKTVSESPHRWPCKGNGYLMLKQMREDIKELEQMLRIAVHMARPEIDLPLVDICIDQDSVFKYCSDLKYVHILRQVIEQLVTEVDIDLTEWLDFFVNMAENLGDPDVY